MNAKKIAAERAVEFIDNGMTVGLGTGSTAYYAIQRIGERIKEGLKIKAVCSSTATEALATQFDIPLSSFSEIKTIDITIDGADEMDRNHNLIKGGGGALLREKILASNSTKFIVIIDESKRVSVLGKFPLPVEIVPFAASLTVSRLQNLGCLAQIRQDNDKDYRTDNGNLIADCRFNEISDPAQLNMQLHLIPGVVETGLFLHTIVSSVIVGREDGTVEML